MKELETQLKGDSQQESQVVPMEASGMGTKPDAIPPSQNAVEPDPKKQLFDNWDDGAWKGVYWSRSWEYTWSRSWSSSSWDQDLGSDASKDWQLHRGWSKHMESRHHEGYAHAGDSPGTRMERALKRAPTTELEQMRPCGCPGSGRGRFRPVFYPLLGFR